MAEQRKQTGQQKKRTRFWEESSAWSSRGDTPLAASGPITIMAPPPTSAAATVNPLEEEEPFFSLAKKKCLHCAVCSGPLKPNVYMCDDRHSVCHSCAARHRYRYCGACNRASSFVHSSGMDTLVDGTKTSCPAQIFGCRERSVPYHQVWKHYAVCEHLPCYCVHPEPRGTFVGDPAMLLRHLTEEHRWPVEKIKYETRHQVVVVPSPSEQHRRLLVAEEDGAVFLLAVDAAVEDGGFCPVGLVRVRRNADNVKPFYVCTLSVRGPLKGAPYFYADSSQHEAQVTNCVAPNEVDVKSCRVRTQVFPSLHGHGENKEIHLGISIMKIRI